MIFDFNNTCIQDPLPPQNIAICFVQIMKIHIVFFKISGGHLGTEKTHTAVKKDSAFSGESMNTKEKNFSTG